MVREFGDSFGVAEGINTFPIRGLVHFGFIVGGYCFDCK